MNTRTLEDVDKDIRRLGDLARDQHKENMRWKIIWERLDQLLEERFTLKLDHDILTLEE